MSTSSDLPLNPPQIAVVLQSTPRMLQELLSTLPMAAWQWRPAPAEWCINEVLGHFVETEQRGFAGRIRLLLEQDGPALEPWDIPGIAARRQDCQRDGWELLEEFAALREQSARLVSGLEASHLQRYGLHPMVGQLWVVDILYEWMHHDARHAKQILGNVQAFVWPHMGRAQGFSQAMGMDQPG